jgi:hypothetical protein
MDIENKTNEEKRVPFSSLKEGDTFRFPTPCSRSDMEEKRYMKIALSNGSDAICLGPNFFYTTFFRNDSEVVKVKGTFVNGDY